MKKEKNLFKNGSVTEKKNYMVVLVSMEMVWLPQSCQLLTPRQSLVLIRSTSKEEKVKTFACVHVHVGVCVFVCVCVCVCVCVSDI